MKRYNQNHQQINTKSDHGDQSHHKDNYVIPMIMPHSNLATVLCYGNSAGKNDINMNGNKITNLPTASNPSDAINLSQAEDLFNNAINLSRAENLIDHSTNLASVLSNGNSAGTSDIDMNDNSIENVDSIKLLQLNEKIPGSGINFFTGYGTSGVKIIYYFSGTINNAGIKVLLKIPLQKKSAYTAIMVAGYYSDGPTNVVKEGKYHDDVYGYSGNYYCVCNIKVGKNTLMLRDQFKCDYSDLPNVNVCLSSYNDFLIINLCTDVSYFDITANGTLELWRH